MSVGLCFLAWIQNLDEEEEEKDVEGGAVEEEDGGKERQEPRRHKPHFGQINLHNYGYSNSKLAQDWNSSDLLGKNTELKKEKCLRK